MIKKKKFTPRVPRTGRRLTRSAKFKLSKDDVIDYKNVNLLQKFLTDRGKIVTRRVTGLNSKQQRKLTSSIKRARYLGLL